DQRDEEEQSAQDAEEYGGIAVLDNAARSAARVDVAELIRLRVTTRRRLDRLDRLDLRRHVDNHGAGHLVEVWMKDYRTEGSLQFGGSALLSNPRWVPRLRHSVRRR
ncbi:MAG: hypothetical protein AAF317_04230, partial [Pseudomonadota bacterium]